MSQTNFTKLTNLIMKCNNCDWVALEWAKYYDDNYHVYFAVIICTFGCVANVINIIVLTNKDLFTAPINRILTGLAVADLILMVEYNFYAYYNHIEHPKTYDFPYWGAVFILFHSHFTQVLHTISICLTLTLAIWRYLAIGYPDNRTLTSRSRCTWAIVLSYIIPIILCSPTYFTLDVTLKLVREDNEQSWHALYTVGLSQMANNSESYIPFNFWTYAVFVKLIPCCILTIINVWLVRTLFKVNRNRQRLKGDNIYATLNSNISGDKIPNKAQKRTDRTTKMLVAVLCLFLVTEFPQAILGFLVAIKGPCFFIKCYQSFGALIDLLALVNGSINFLLYCSMNRMFRLAFGKIFLSRIWHVWQPPTPSDTHTTYI